jgi:hypothetical protein
VAPLIWILEVRVQDEAIRDPVRRHPTMDRLRYFLVQPLLGNRSQDKPGGWHRACLPLPPSCLSRPLPGPTPICPRPKDLHNRPAVTGDIPQLSPIICLASKSLCTAPSSRVSVTRPGQALLRPRRHPRLYTGSLFVKCATTTQISCLGGMRSNEPGAGPRKIFPSPRERRQVSPGSEHVFDRTGA